MPKDNKNQSLLDITANRKSRKWTRKELVGRILWGFTYPFFRFSPRPLWGWRRLLLRFFGANIGKQVHIYPTVKIIIPWNINIDDYTAIGDCVTLYALGKIHIGSSVTISQGAHLCAGTHNYLDPEMPLLKVPIIIKSGVWVCADAFISSGVTIEKQSIIAARSVVVKNIAANIIVGGNPAHFIKKREFNDD